MIKFKLNGQESTFDGDPDMPLLWYVRDIAGLSGTKFGCGMGLCGACTATARRCGPCTSVARHGEITAKNGAIEQSNFNDYPVTRINEAPYQTNIHLVENDAPPAGVGEPGVPPFVPALCNAISAATGQRIRELPLSKLDFSKTEKS
jgi:hypothetical protein